MYTSSTRKPISNKYSLCTLESKDKGQKASIRESLHRLCVSGYIRKHCLIYEVPKVLQHLIHCLAIEPMEEWHQLLSNEDLIYNSKPNSDNNICRLIEHKRSSNKWRNVFGKLIITKGEAQTWKLRIINIANSDQFLSKGKLKRSVMIGIINCDNNISNDTCNNSDINSKCSDKSFHKMYSYFADTRHKNICDGYAFYAYDGNLFCTKDMRRKYSKPWDRGDIITMNLDMTQSKHPNGILSFEINNKKQGIAFDNIDINKAYCLAVSFFFEEEVEIIND